mgnify:CR=1 FL=1
MHQIHLKSDPTKVIQGNGFLIEDDNGVLDFKFNHMNCQRGGEDNALHCLHTFLNERHKNYSKKRKILF